jgi:hypothetical protein
MKRSSGRWVCFLLPLLSGCFPLLYAYPSLSFVPSINAGPVPDKVYAFRVNITDERNGAELPDQDRYVFREIPVSETARVPFQAKLDVDRGWVFFGPEKYFAHTRHTVVVRLYRPGYQTVEVARAKDAKQVNWVEAKDVGGREKAVDDLLSTWKTDKSGQEAQFEFSRMGQSSPREMASFRCLAPGSAGEKHRQFLLFAAGQYFDIEILNGFGGPAVGSDLAEDHQRRMAKVDWLRKRASE